MDYSTLLRFRSWPAAGVNKSCMLQEGNTHKLSQYSLRWNEEKLYCSSFSQFEKSTRSVLSLKNLVYGGSIAPVACTAAYREATMGACEGIGITNFLQGKCYFVTGSTGHLGKVLLEKMLRTVPNVEKIWILIKAENIEAASKRLNKEIIESELFRYVKQERGSSYKTFMLSKLIPVVGDVGQSNMGMNDNIIEAIAKEVDVIIHTAASTKFDERYDTALNINTMGPSRLLNFAKRCKNLPLYVHISTAYVNRETEGIILEKPFEVDQSMRSDDSAAETIDTLQHLDIETELNLASQYMKQLHKDRRATHKMKALGLERAKKFGWPNTYSFTKAMAEMLLDSNRDEIPVVIIRPTVVESTYKKPFGGWIEGTRMLDPLLVLYGKGKLPGFLGDSQTILDVVPVDMVVNVILAATTKHGTDKKIGQSVYHVASSLVNPLPLGDVFCYSRKYFMAFPFYSSNGSMIGIPDFTFYNTMKSFTPYITQILHEQCRSGLSTSNDVKYRQHEAKSKRQIESILQMAKLYEPYAFYLARFDSENTQRLLKEMSVEENIQYGFDVASINWKDYFVNIHVAGLLKYAIKGRTTVY